MSTEEMTTDLTNEHNAVHTEEVKKVKKPYVHKVDINTLMERVRTEKKQEKKENLIFLSLIASAVLITGVIASL